MDIKMEDVLAEIREALQDRVKQLMEDVKWMTGEDALLFLNTLAVYNINLKFDGKEELKGDGIGLYTLNCVEAILNALTASGTLQPGRKVSEIYGIAPIAHAMYCFLFVEHLPTIGLRNTLKSIPSNDVHTLIKHYGINPDLIPIESFIGVIRFISPQPSSPLPDNVKCLIPLLR